MNGKQGALTKVNCEAAWFHVWMGLIFIKVAPPWPVHDVLTGTFLDFQGPSHDDP
jgi:hypothetical protein